MTIFLNRPAVIVACASSLLAATALTAPRQAGPASGGVSGSVVVDDRDVVPLGGAIVAVTGGSLGKPRMTVTDAAGAFSVSDLPSGRYTVTASKPAFVGMAYGASRAGVHGTAIWIDRGIRTGIVIRLPRGSVITGVVRDHRGQQLSDVSIWAVKVGGASGSSAAGRVITDDRGLYRVFGLAEGEYLVAAVPPGAGLASVEMPTTADLDRRLGDLARNSRAGGTNPGVPRVRTGPAYGIVPTFYPGTHAASQAVPLRLGPGEERVADLTIGPVRSGTMSGVIETYDGSRLPSVTLEVELDGPPLPSELVARPRLTRVPMPDDGRFTFEGVVPGSYIFAARAAAPPSSAGSETPQWARAEVASAGDDVAGIRLTLFPALKLEGTVAFESSGSRQQAAYESIRVGVTRDATSAGRTPRVFRVADPRAVSPGTSGAFSLAGIMPGTYSITADVPEPWWLRSAMVNGVDVLDMPIQLSQSHDQIRLTFSDRAASISGSVTTDEGRAADLVVVAFPADDRLWRRGARRIKSTRTSTDGHFALTRLPGGDYMVAALAADLDPDRLGDPEVLSSLVSHSVRVTLDDGEARTLDLQSRQPRR